MTAAENPMKSIFSKLSECGYKRPFVKSLLPDWWSDEIAATPAGIQQVGLLLGRLLGVKPESIWGDDQIALSIPEKRKFKRRVNTQEVSLDVSCAIAFAAGRLANKGFSTPYSPESVLDAGELREKLLETSPWVGLADLLEYCASIGIPVIFVKHFPSGAKKMAGLAFEVDGRPIIVLTQSKPHGYLLFDLAHEMGHVALRHIKDGQLVVDANIDPDSDDEDEKAANRFALELLTGDPDCRVVPAGRNLAGEELATAASRFGVERKVDPTHVVLNYAHTKAHWGAATIALASLARAAGKSESDQQLVVDSLLSRIEEEFIGEDDLAVLKKYIGASE